MIPSHRDTIRQGYQPAGASKGLPYPLLALRAGITTGGPLLVPRAGIRAGVGTLLEGCDGHFKP